MPKKVINLDGQDIDFEIKVSRRVKNLRLEMTSSGFIVVKPWLIPDLVVNAFINKNKEWMRKTWQRNKHRKSLPKVDPENLAIFKKRAAKILISRLEFFNQHYHYHYKSISIRNQKTRWGSCSRAKALNFNYNLISLPENLLDYVVVHELCHLKEMNHSAKFWKLVAKTIPDYLNRRRELANYSL